jgi:hypothetical protein
MDEGFVEIAQAASTMELVIIKLNEKSHEES